MVLRLARIALVGVLLATWQAALQHPIEHVDRLGELVHLPGGHSDDGGPLCDLLASLTACAPQSGGFHAQFFCNYPAPSYAVGAPRVADAPPFLSQGPPASV